MDNLQNRLVQGKWGGELVGNRDIAQSEMTWGMCVWHVFFQPCQQQKGSHGTDKSVVLSLVPWLTLLMLAIFSTSFYITSNKKKKKREKKISFSAAHKLFYNLSVEKKQKGEGTSKCGIGSVTVVFVSINLRAQECMRYLHKSFHNSCGLWEHCICMTSPLRLVCAFSAALPATGSNPGHSQ